MKRLLILLCLPLVAAAQPASHPRYLTPAGSIRINGAEYVQSIFEAIDALYAAAHPGTTFDLQLKGTSSAIPDLTFGVTLIAPMGREVSPIERVPYSKIVGEQPLEIRIAHDATDSKTLATSLAVYVNRSNPVSELTREQISGLFTTGGKGWDLTRWGQVGASGEWAKRPVHPVGTPEYTGFGDFLQHHLFNGLPLSPSYEFAPDSAEILKRVSEDPEAVGIAAAGRGDPTLKAVATIERYLYVYVRRVPGQPLDPVAKAYVQLLLSPQGQGIVVAKSHGYLALSEAEVAAETAKLDEADPAPAVEPLPEPAPGAIYVVGNDGMQSLLDKLNARFCALHPGVHFSMLLRGSSTGISGLTSGVAAIAPMGREAWPTDLSGFKETYGYLPLDIHIGYDAYTGPKRKSPPGVYVNAKNPLASLTMDQLRRVLTTGASKGDLTHWGQLGLTGKWAPRAIHLYGPRDEGGFASSLRMNLLMKLPFSARYEPLPKNADIADAVAADPYGLGLVSFYDAAQSPGIRMVPLSAKKGESPALASYAEVSEGRYPLSPLLHLYFNRAPGSAMDPVLADYVRFVLSAEGQAIVASEKESEEGYVPLAAADIPAELAKLN